MVAYKDVFAAMHGVVGGKDAEKLGQRLEPVEEVFSRIASRRWPLAAREELRFMEEGLRAAFAYAHDTTVQSLHVMDGSLFRVSYPYNDALAPEVLARASRGAAFALADAMEVRAFASRIRRTRPMGIDEAGDRERAALATLADPVFLPGLEYVLVEHHGPVGVLGAIVIAETVREHLLRVLAGDADAMALSGNVLRALQCVIPVGTRHDDPTRVLVFVP